MPEKTHKLQASKLDADTACAALEEHSMPDQGMYSVCVCIPHAALFVPSRRLVPPPNVKNRELPASNCPDTSLKMVSAVQPYS